MLRSHHVLLTMLVSVGVLSACSEGPANGAAPASAAAQKEEPVVEATPAQLVKAYEENTLAADELYKDKKVKITGKVGDINTDMMGYPYITMQAGPNQFMLPQFSFDKEQSTSLAKLKKGSQVTVICTGSGDIAKTPMFTKCELQ